MTPTATDQYPTGKRWKSCVLTKSEFRQWINGESPFQCPNCGFIFNHMRPLLSRCSPAGTMNWRYNDANLLGTVRFCRHKTFSLQETDPLGRDVGEPLLGMEDLHFKFPADSTGMVAAALTRLAFQEGLLFRVGPPGMRLTYQDAVSAKIEPYSNHPEHQLPPGCIVWQVFAHNNASTRIAVPCLPSNYPS